MVKSAQAASQDGCQPEAIAEGGFVYRSVMPSKRSSGLRKALNRVEGLLIGIALFWAVFYLFGWFNP
jgi:hypothetical protein